MELKIYNPTEGGFVKAIQWNNEELKQELTTKMQDYSTVVYGPDQIKEAKADRARLSKFLKGLEDKRKEIKKRCMEPYEQFETQMKELTGIVSEAITSIDTQVKAYEEQQKEDKKVAIALTFDDFKDAGKVPEYVSLEQIFEDRYLNKSESMNKIKADMEAKLTKIGEDAAMLAGLPEFGFEAMEVYKSTLDVNQAVKEAQRMSEMAKKKAAAEEEKKLQKAQKQAAEDFFGNAMNAPVAQNSDDVEGQISFTDPQSFNQVVKAAAEEEAPQRMWVAFKAYMTTEDALALKEFFQSRNITFGRA